MIGYFNQMFSAPQSFGLPPALQGTPLHQALLRLAGDVIPMFPATSVPYTGPSYRPEDYLQSDEPMPTSADNQNMSLAQVHEALRQLLFPALRPVK